MDYQGIYQHLKDQFEANKRFLAEQYTKEFMQRAPLSDDNHGAMARASGLVDMFNISPEDAGRIVTQASVNYTGPRPPAHQMPTPDPTPGA